MSELKVASCFEFEKVLNGKSNKLFYPKSEADKLIAEKDTKIIQLEAFIENYNRISREIIDNANHKKYKLCLAKAEMCSAKCDKWMMKKANAIGLGKDGVEYFLKARRKVFHYMRWQQRWLKIAERFKEAK